MNVIELKNYCAISKASSVAAAVLPEKGYNVLCFVEYNKQYSFCKLDSVTI